MLGVSTDSASSVTAIRGSAIQGALSSPAARPRLFTWTTVVFCIAAAVGIWRRAGAFHAAGHDADESVYIVIARRWLEGDLPYVAVYDSHPVGLPALLAGLMWLFGDGILVARLTALLAVAGTCAALFFAGARFAGSRAIGGVAALLYGIYMVRPEALVPNTEIYNNLLVATAACLLFGQAERIRAGQPIVRTRALLAAGLLGVGLQIKYVIAPEAIGFCLAVLTYWLRRGGTMRAVAGLAAGMMAAGVTATLVVAGYFWLQGGLDAFLDANIRSNLSYIAVVPGFVDVLERIHDGFRPLLVVAVGAAMLPILLRRWPQLLTPGTRRLASACALWLVLSAVNVVLPMKFFPHYFFALLPPLCLLVAVVVVSSVTRIQALAGRRLGPIAATFAVLVAVVVLAAPPLRAIAKDVAAPPSPLARSTALAAACIHQHPANQPGLYVFNWDPILYELTRTQPPTRFILPAELAEYGDAAGVDGAAEISRILAGRPGHIVTASLSYVPFSPEKMALVDRALAKYELVCSIPMRVTKDESGYARVYRLP